MFFIYILFWYDIFYIYKKTKNMPINILGIESSCDETSASVISNTKFYQILLQTKKFTKNMVVLFLS